MSKPRSIHPVLLAKANRRPKRRSILWIALGFAFIAIVISVIVFKALYPYGLTHACTKGLALSLRMYATDHGGSLPHGGRTPEESLSFLVRGGDPHGVRTLLRGKHLPQSVVDFDLGTDGVLSPASCGWHYVEGLRIDDNPGLAVGWDKISGLKHNGRLKKELEREVMMLDGSTRHIMKSEWPAFCAEQQRLLAETAATRKPGDPPIRWSDETALGPNKVPPRSQP